MYSYTGPVIVVPLVARGKALGAMALFYVPQAAVAGVLGEGSRLAVVLGRAGPSPA